MCIVCNCVGHEEDAEAFLQAWKASQDGMRAAIDAMLRVSKTCGSADDKKRYDRLHKRMVQMMRDWNRLEESREHVPEEATETAGLS